jgi:glycosyltransferase involved in cell wall biosynthesis
MKADFVDPVRGVSMRNTKRICIVTSAHISYNPRAMKEADALAAAGHDVRVVGLNREDDKCRLDAEIVASRPWAYDVVDARRSTAMGSLRVLGSRVRMESSSVILAFAPFPGVLERGYSRYFPELLARLAAIEADLFIAHNLPALPVAVVAARRCGAKIGFDAEDFHRGEFAAESGNERVYEQTIAIERKYIPCCDYVTAASDGIAAAYSEALGIPRPTSILNVFPLSSREVQLSDHALRGERSDSELSLYWCSQVIGPGRGLEIAVKALSLLQGRFTLALRGHWMLGYRDALMELAGRLRVDHLIRELPVSRPEELVSRASMHDIGLACEIPNTVNHRIAVSNKLLAYLVAGIPVAASDVPGQATIMANIPDAGFLYPASDPDALARGLLALGNSPARLTAAKIAASKAAEARFCWEIESQRLVATVESVLANHGAA